jgi:hypothetical protein
MEIRIGKYKISTDKHNFMVEEEVLPKRKRSESGGQPYWITLSYHPTLEAACNKLVQYEVKSADATELARVIACVADSTEAITSAVGRLKEAPVLRGDK